jgi:hypothetical protein
LLLQTLVGVHRQAARDHPFVAGPFAAKAGSAEDKNSLDAVMKRQV